MTRVESKLSVIRWAVPAFIRVEPAIGSAPVSRKIPWSASLMIGVSRLLAMPTVKVPRLRELARRPARVTGEDPQAAQFVKLRYFTGLSVEEAAEMVGLSQSAAYKHWAYARAWLRRRLNAPGRSAGD